LERFFRGQQELGRPQPAERWTSADLTLLLAILEEEYDLLSKRGRVGLDVYAEFELQQLRADLTVFLERDNEFRAETGAVPSEFEKRLLPTAVGDVFLTGLVDRIDRTPDGTGAWVIDYKTGSSSQFETASDSDPFSGGTKLQLPVYGLAAANSDRVSALYWFVSRRAEFRRIHYDDSPENRERFEATLQAVLAGLRGGSFPAIPGDEDDFHGGFTNCRYCDFDRLCARRRNYELQVKWDDAGLAPWRHVGETSRGENLS
jgi:hypothetical protein